MAERRNIVKKVLKIPTRMSSFNPGDKVLIVHSEGQDAPEVYKDGVAWNDLLGADRFELGIVMNLSLGVSRVPAYANMLEILAVDTETK